MDRRRDVGRSDVCQRSFKRRVVRVPVLQLGGAFAVALMAMAGNAFAMSPTPDIAPAAKYVNPLAHAKVTPERIDQGVDYAGTGNLNAIGWARITRVETKNTGWPGAFIEYHLLHGGHAGRWVYYAEGVRPANGIHVGRLVRPGRVVAHLIPGWSSGIEIGWGANIGTETLAAEHHQYTYPTRCGRNFSAFVKALGGPPGKAEGTSMEGATRYGRP
ncbi:MAG TPA: hypothetical protein VFB39_06380 [Solirubrobacteraceae bacterium]|nr:hypothetical protein [Solirubrobacteraceae bacterium]